MYCPKCGNNVEDGSLFCSECGAEVVNNAEPIETAENVYNSYEQTAPNTDGYGVYTPPVGPELPKANNKKKIIIASAVAVGVAGTALAATLIFNKNERDLSVAKDHFDYVMEVNLQESASALANMTQVYKNVASMQNEADIELTVDDRVKTLISMMAGSAGDYVEWIDKIGIGVGTSADEDRMAYDIGISANDTEVCAVEIIMDGDDSATYMGFPGISDTYIKQDSYNSSFYPQNIVSISEIIPNSDTARDLYYRYMLGVMKQITEVEKSEETLTVGDVSQTATKLTAVIDGDTLKNMAEWALNEAKNDKEIETIIKNAVDVMDYGYMDSDEVYDEFIESIDEAVEELEDPYAIEEFEPISIDFYVDGNHKLIGFGFEEENTGAEIYSYTVMNGQEYETIFNIESDYFYFTVEGAGTEADGKRTGEYTVSCDAGMTGFDFDFAVANVDVALAKQGIFNGGIEFEIPEELLDELDVPSYAASVLSQLTWCVESSTTDINNQNSNLKIKMGDEEFVNLGISMRRGEPKEVKIPDDYIEDRYSDYEEKEELRIDVMKGIADGLKEAGAPSGITSLIEDYLY